MLAADAEPGAAGAWAVGRLEALDLRVDEAVVLLRFGLVCVETDQYGAAQRRLKQTGKGSVRRLLMMTTCSAQ